MSECCNDDLGIRKMNEARAEVRGNTETPTQRCEHSTTFAHVDVLRVTLPGIAHNVAPLQPMCENSLARVRVMATTRSH